MHVRMRDIDEFGRSKRRWFEQARQVVMVNGWVFNGHPRTEHSVHLSLSQVSSVPTGFLSANAC